MSAFPPLLSQESLEAIAVAILRATDSRGLRIALYPQDVLQPWALEQFNAMCLRSPRAPEDTST